MDSIHSFCRKCGHELPTDAAFCPKCGTSLATSAVPSAPVAPVPARKKRGWMITGCLGLAVFLVLCGAISIVMRSGSTTALGPVEPQPTKSAAAYSIIDVRELTKNADSFRGELVRLEGEVFRIEERGNQTQLQMWVAPPGSETLDREPVMVTIASTLPGVYEESEIEVFGTMQGKQSGTNVFGATLSQPHVEADRVENLP